MRATRWACISAPPRATSGQARAKAPAGAASRATCRKSIRSRRPAASGRSHCQAAKSPRRRMAASSEVSMNFTIEHEREEDGRWLAEVPELPGVLAYGATATEAMAKAEVLALRVLAERLEHNEAGPQSISIAIPAT